MERQRQGRESAIPTDPPEVDRSEAEEGGKVWGCVGARPLQTQSLAPLRSAAGPTGIFTVAAHRIFTAEARRGSAHGPQQRDLETLARDLGAFAAEDLATDAPLQAEFVEGGFALVG